MVVDMMEIDKIIEFIKNTKWEDVKDLPHNNRRLYIDVETKIADNKRKKSSWVYFTIFDSSYNKMDRYFGSETKSEVNHFMESEYCGSVVTYKKEFKHCLKSKDYRVICLRIESDSDILILEEDVLDKINASENKQFFNSSNISGGILKTLGNQMKLYDEVRKNITKGFRVGKMCVDKLYNLKRGQPRLFDIDWNHVNDIIKDATETKGKCLEGIRPTILLEDYYGKGIHKRGGNTHTLECIQNKTVREYVDEIDVVYWPKESWSKCDEDTITNVLRWDNAKKTKISIKHNSIDEIVDSCKKLAIKYNLAHNDVRVKDLAFSQGATGSEWQTVRKKVKDILEGVKTDNNLPDGMERIIYTDANIKETEKEGTSDISDCKVLTTVGAGGSIFTGYEFILNWLIDSKNEKRRLHIIFMHGKQSFEIHEEKWEKNSANVKNIIRTLFKKFKKEKHITFDTMDRYRPKTNKVIG